jgi:hypothetical protein
MLCVCAGSSVDQHSNNVSLFNLIEQVSIAPLALFPPPGTLIPIEAHAYWQLRQDELQRELAVRYVMVDCSTGLETPSEPLKHRTLTLRMRSRIVGLPLPPVPGNYELCVDARSSDAEAWQRQAPRWPLRMVEATQAPRVTH